MNYAGKISIVIPVFNGAGTLRKTLQTIRNQDDVDWETIVVDDGSTERIESLAEEMGARFLRLPENRGPATARTEGAKIADGDIILFTDSDVWLPENLVGRIRKDFEEQDCECVQGTFSKHCPHANFYSQYKNLYNRYTLSLLGPWIATTYTSVTAVKKDFFFSSGGFDCGVRGASVEDRTLGQSLIQAGGRIYFDGEIEVIHNKLLTAGGFYRSQFRRSGDLAKLMRRQKERGFLKKGSSFGTNTKSAMLRIPVAGAVLLGCLLSIMSVPFLLPTVCSLGLYVWMTRSWIGYLRREKGGRFAAIGQAVDFTDALVSGAGVARGFFEYFALKRRY